MGQLVAAVLLLVTVALTGISAAGVTVLHEQLLDRTDSELEATADNYARLSVGGKPPALPPPGGSGVHRFELRDADGRLVKDFFSLVAVAGSPDVPQDAAWLDKHAGRPVTLPAPAADESWRVMVQPLEKGSGWVVVATALGQLNNTISQLIQVDLAVGAIGLALLAIAGVAIVRASLRPLLEVERTAAAIAAGDLSQRVPEHPPQTELGRLTRALNGMLTQIEEAFLARTRSESAERAPG